MTSPLGLLHCSCLLCRLEVWVSPDGQPPFLDVLGLGGGYKLLTHDCDNDDLEAMWDDLGLIPSLISPANFVPDRPH